MSTMSQQPFHVIGRGVERRDGLGHVTGTTEYIDDVRYPGMLHLKMVRNPLVHARIRGIDLSEAEKVPGFVRALTAADVPKNVYTILCLIGVEPDEEQVLASERVRYRGEPIVAVVAETEAAAVEAVKRVRVGPRGAARGVRRRGGAEAGRPAGHALGHEPLLVRGPSLPAGPLRRRGRGARHGAIT